MKSSAAAWAFLAVAIAFNTLGNLLLKKAGMAEVSSRFELFLSWAFVLGGLLFGLNLLAYTQAQAGLALSVGYPVLIGLSMIGVAAGASYFFGEVITPMKLGGIALILVGIAMLARA